MQLNTSKTIVDNQNSAASKSFQNCTEADLVGYNDCPTFLFSKNSSIKEKSGSTSLRKKKTLRKVSAASGVSLTPDLENAGTINISSIEPMVLEYGENDEDILSNEEIILLLKEKVENNEKNLAEKEFNFYKLKFLNQLPSFSENERYLRNLSDIFLMSTGSSETKLLVQSWVSKEPCVSGWLIPLSKLI
ncbi:hypothetical protein QEN19_000322 [Hanseniaspora menglaensis]